MIFLNTRFNINNRVEKATKVELLDKIKINDNDEFQRIPLQKIEQKIGWRKNKPLSNGKYKVTYNEIDYFMTFLDELDLFTQVVLQGKQ